MPGSPGTWRIACEHHASVTCRCGHCVRRCLRRVRQWYRLEGFESLIVHNRAGRFDSTFDPAFDSTLDSGEASSPEASSQGGSAPGDQQFAADDYTRAPLRHGARVWTVNFVRTRAAVGLRSRLSSGVRSEHRRSSSARCGVPARPIDGMQPHPEQPLAAPGCWASSGGLSG